jgi:ribosomal protein L11 methyltransferase
MPYIQVTIQMPVAALREVLIAELSNAGFDGFEETDDALIAFVQPEQYEEAYLAALAVQHQFAYTAQSLEDKNWNQVWEENFEPVIVPGVCTVRAHFHDITVTTPYDIQITPKMSFGTGHHATTKLMMMQMSQTDFKGKQVFDFGTGTGILAILAEMMGAVSVLAIDNDEWSYDNSKENAERNNCKHISLMHGSLEMVPAQEFDVVLANINRNILLYYMDALFSFTRAGGTILMSGLLKDDEEVIMLSATLAGFNFSARNEMGGWIMIAFTK